MKEKKEIIENIYKEKKLDLIEFKLLSETEQSNTFYEILNEMYEKKVEINKALINKCFKIKSAKKDDYMILPYKLIVEKKEDILIFKFENKTKKFPLLILFGIGLAIVALSALFSGILYMQYSSINKDIDGDGIPDINLDIDGDNKPDINIDINNDGKPDLNIDYKGNKLPIFNLDTTGDGEPDFNLVVDATDDPDSCKVNCDIDGDGWPDYNFDIDGDGEPDLDIYDPTMGTVIDKVDINGDMVCDVMCDDDGDGVCDRNCIIYDDEILGCGPSSSTGNSGNYLESGSLVIQYGMSSDLFVANIMPDDQPGYTTEDYYPSNTFTVTNQSDFSISYKITMTVDKNTYISNNFMYKLESTNKGYNSDYEIVPWSDKLITSYVVIEPNETQEYTITFKLNGINSEQNYDQGQIFAGNIVIGN